MALLQISEPGASESAKKIIRKNAVGIDLGTTNSLVATIENGQPYAIQGGDQSSILPSAVRYLSGETNQGSIDEKGALVVGQEALAAYATDPSNCLISVKRFMGRGAEEMLESGASKAYRMVAKDGLPYFETVQGLKSPVEVSAEILKQLKLMAEAHFAKIRQSGSQPSESQLETELDAGLSGVVITVPAYFDDAQRQATKDAATLAGLNVLRLLNEPTAAAVAYGLDQQSEGQHLVFDLGGGTFDVSILKMNQGVFQVLATGGNSALGGDDFDTAIVDWFLEEHGISAPSTELFRAVKQAARQVKESLSESESAQMLVAVEVQDLQSTLSRSEFNRLIDPLIDLTIDACHSALADAEIAIDQLDEIILVGGSTRTLRVVERLAEEFGKQPLNSLDVDRVVALGAAIQADTLVGNVRADGSSAALLLDVIPLSLGVETMGGLVEKIIPRNSTIPLARAQEFTTYQDGQTAMSIHIVQGERELVQDCRSLARFELRGIPPMVAGAAKVKVTYQVDADGLLSVLAKELSTGIESQIQVKPSYGLGEDQVAQMLKASFEHAKVDVSERMLREQQVDGERLRLALLEALEADGRRLLGEAEYVELEKALDLLQQQIQGSDPSLIEASIKEVNAASEAFAARRMDESIRKALQGQSLDQLDQ